MSDSVHDTRARGHFQVHLTEPSAPLISILRLLLHCASVQDRHTFFTVSLTQSIAALPRRTPPIYSISLHRHTTFQPINIILAFIMSKPSKSTSQLPPPSDSLISATLFLSFVLKPHIHLSILASVLSLIHSFIL